MAQRIPPTAQQRDARELAKTRPADPYRSTLTDPFTVATVPPNTAVSADPAGPSPLAAAREITASAQSAVAGQRGTPVSATWAGILGIVLGVVLALLGMLLLTILGLQDDYGAPDRSYYRGTDSGYVVLALVNFGLAGCCSIGGITLMTGRVTGRVWLTAGGWATLSLSAFWLLRGQVANLVPIIIGLVAATMLLLAYHRPVTRWLGILPPPQPE